MRLFPSSDPVVIWASIGVYSEKNSDEIVADSTKSLVKAILGVAWWVLLSLDLETLVIGQVNVQTITKHVMSLSKLIQETLPFLVISD